MSVKNQDSKPAIDAGFEYHLTVLILYFPYLQISKGNGHLIVWMEL